MALAIAPTTIARDMNPRTLNRTAPLLHTLPYLVFRRICDFVEPLWLNNLSNTCIAMRTKLSFDDGNLIWYRALPAYILPDELYQPTPGRPAPLLDRLLGGHYRPECDYKREIFGRLAGGLRCQVCLRPITGRTKPWNVRLCQFCFERYTISKFILCSFSVAGKLIYIIASEQVYSLGVPGVGAALANLAHPPIFVRNVPRFYRPEIDQIIRNITGVDVGAKMLVNQKQDQMTLMVRLEASEEERIRRVARHKLVQYARLIWDGHDPMPNRIYCESSGILLGTESRQGMPDVNTFRAFRERFAPTNKLHEFLYPAYSLSDRPTQLPYQPGYWLKDPALVLTQDNPTVEDVHWYVEKALEMLEALTNCDKPGYSVRRSGKPVLGGWVTTWVNAAKAYHVDRLEKELKSGATVNISHTTGAPSSSHLYRRIRKLRYRSGLQEQGETRMRPLSPHLDIAECMARSSIDMWLAREHIISRLEREQAQCIKWFNKVVRRTSFRCPVCGDNHVYIGVEDPVDHVRIHHRARFWKSDDWHTAG